MRLVSFGAGYVGLVSGTGLAELGHDVLLVDVDPERIRNLREGRIPIYEPGLSEIVRRNVRNRRLHFDTKISPPYDEADAYFVCVGTPPDESGAADISAVLAVADQIRSLARKASIVVVKSTVPVGTCDAIEERLKASPVRLEVASNPEFLKEGDAVNDFFKPDRVIVGARSESARSLLRDLYSPLQLSGERLVMTDPRSSELIKYAANTMLAMRVSFMNEISRLCHVSGADIHAVRMGVGSDSRIGRKFLYAGPGYGGSCFPKDVLALAALGRSKGVPMLLAEATHEANEEQSRFVQRLLEEGLSSFAGKTIALWGLSFKPETDDVRQSPATKLTRAIIDGGGRVRAHDPEAGPNFAKMFSSGVDVVERDYEALDGACALVLLTEWRSYRAPDFAEVRRRLVDGPGGQRALVVDARNIWKPSIVTAAGLRYQGLGVGAAPPIPTSPRTR
jgi:UDPglucose 6-dehydrogenase